MIIRPCSFIIHPNVLICTNSRPQLWLNLVKEGEKAEKTDWSKNSMMHYNLLSFIQNLKQKRKKENKEVINDRGYSSDAFITVRREGIGRWAEVCVFVEVVSERGEIKRRFSRSIRYDRWGSSVYLNSLLEDRKDRVAIPINRSNKRDGLSLLRLSSIRKYREENIKKETRKISRN